MPPKPCLKVQLRCDSDPLPFASSSKALLSPHVHFPPTPTLASTHFADSPWTYDRAPIEISPNLCALPERGGRMYAPTSKSTSRMRAKGSHFHPNAYEVREREPSEAHMAAPPPPSLIPDFSSESDESDGSVATPPEPNPITFPISVHTQISHTHPQEMLDNALSFFPHPPSLRDREKGRRQKSPGRRRHQGDMSNDVFVAPTLDGCLGGF